MSISPALESGVATQLTSDNRTLAKAQALEGAPLWELALLPFSEGLPPRGDALAGLLEGKTPVGQPANKQT